MPALQQYLRRVQRMVASKGCGNECSPAAGGGKCDADAEICSPGRVYVDRYGSNACVEKGADGYVYGCDGYFYARHSDEAPWGMHG